MGIFRKKNKGLITEKIIRARESIREMDELFEDLQKYFEKLERRVRGEFG